MSKISKDLSHSNSPGHSGSRVFARIAHYVYRYPWRLLLGAALLSLVSGWPASRLTLVTEMADLIPADNPRVQVFERMKREVGSTTPLRVTLTGGDLEATAAFMTALADSLERTPYIRWTRTRTHRDFFLANRLLYLPLADLESIYTSFDNYIEAKKLEQSPLYVALDDDPAKPPDLEGMESRYRARMAELGLDSDYFLTREKEGMVLLLFPDGDNTDVRFARQLLTHVRAVVAALDPHRYDPGLQIYYSGSFVNQLYDLERILHDARAAVLYGVAGVLLLLVLYFRQIFAPVFIVVPLGMSLLWTFGLTGLFIGSLNQVTVVLFAVLFGLGIDFGIHIFARYREARQRGRDVEAALTETVTRTGRSLATAAATTSLAFYSLTITDFKGFSQFGFIAGTGILFSLVAMVALGPACIVVAERLGLVRLEREGEPRRFLRGPYPWPYLTLFLGLLVTTYALFHVRDLSFDYDLFHLRFPPPPPPPGGHLPDHLKATNSPAIVLTRTAEEARQVVQAVEQRQAARKDSSTVESVQSVYSLLPQDQPAKLRILADLRRLIERAPKGLLDARQQARVDSLRPLLEVEPLTLQDLPGDLVEPFRSKEGRILPLVAIHPAVSLDDGRVVRRFADEIGTFRTSSGATYYASSSNLVFGDMMRVMIADARLAVVLTLLVVFLVVLADFRRLSRALLVMLPLLVGLLWTCGIMYGFGIRLNFYNMVVFPSIIGMGIDNNIHLLHRYLEEGKGALLRVLRTTGKALLATSLTTMVGFSGLVFGHHPGLRSIGLLALVGLGACLLSALTLLPAVLQMLERKVDSRCPIKATRDISEGSKSVCPTE